jgi:hypothetical protein
MEQTKESYMITHWKSKLDNYIESINFYKDNKINYDATHELESIELLKQKLINLNSVEDGTYIQPTGPKVKVTTYDNKIYIQTFDSNKFDIEFSPVGLGSIGCTLTNNTRLEISQEALDAIKGLKRVRDCIGDFMGDKNTFSWIGDLNMIHNMNSVVSKDFRLPQDYILIDNITDISNFNEVTDIIEKKEQRELYLNDSMDVIDYNKLNFDLWVEIRLQSEWVENPITKTSSYKPTGKRTVEFTFHEKDLYKEELKKPLLNLEHESCLNSNEFRSGYKSLRMPTHKTNEMKANILNAFKLKTPKYSFEKIFIEDDKLIKCVNVALDAGFENNIMNPQLDYFRLSIVGTSDEILNATRQIKAII